SITPITTRLNILVDTTLPVKYVKFPTRVWDDHLGYVDLVWATSGTTATWTATNYPSTITGTISGFKTHLTKIQLRDYILRLKLGVAGHTPAQVPGIFTTSDKIVDEVIDIQGHINTDGSSRASTVITTKSGKKFAFFINIFRGAHHFDIYPVNNDGTINITGRVEMEGPGGISKIFMTNPNHLVVCGSNNIWEFHIDDDGIISTTPNKISLSGVAIGKGFAKMTSKTHMIYAGGGKKIGEYDLNSQGEIVESSLKIFDYGYELQGMSIIQTSPTRILFTSFFNTPPQSITLDKTGALILSSLKQESSYLVNGHGFVRTSPKHVIYLSRTGLVEFDLNTDGTIKPSTILKTPLTLFQGASFDGSLGLGFFIKIIDKQTLFLSANGGGRKFLLHINNDGTIGSNKPKEVLTNSYNGFKPSTSDSFVTTSATTTYVGYLHQDNKLHKISWLEKVLADVTATISDSIITFAKPNGGPSFDFQIEDDHLKPISANLLLEAVINNELKSIIAAKYSGVTPSIALNFLPKTVHVNVHGTVKDIKITWALTAGKLTWTSMGNTNSKDDHHHSEIEGFLAIIDQTAYDTAIAKVTFTKGSSSYIDSASINADHNHKIFGSTKDDETAKMILAGARFVPYSFGTGMVVSTTFGSITLFKEITGFASEQAKIKTELTVAITAMVTNKSLPIKYTKLPTTVWNEELGYVDVVWTSVRGVATWHVVNLLVDTMTGTISGFPEKMSSTQLKSYIENLKLPIVGKTPTQIKTLFDTHPKTIEEKIAFSHAASVGTGFTHTLIITSKSGKKFLVITTPTTQNLSIIPIKADGTMDVAHKRIISFVTFATGPIIQTNPNMLLVGSWNKGIIQIKLDNNANEVSRTTFTPAQGAKDMVWGGFKLTSKHNLLITDGANKKLYQVLLDDEGKIIPETMTDTGLSARYKTLFMKTSSSNILVGTKSVGMKNVELDAIGRLKISTASTFRTDERDHKMVAAHLSSLRTGLKSALFSIMPIIFYSITGFKELTISDSGKPEHFSIIHSFTQYQEKTYNSPKYGRFVLQTSPTHVIMINEINGFVEYDLDPLTGRVIESSKRRLVITGINAIAMTKRLSMAAETLSSQNLFLLDGGDHSHISQITLLTQLLGDVTTKVDGNVITFTKPSGVTVHLVANAAGTGFVNAPEVYELTTKIKRLIKNIDKTLPIDIIEEMLPKEYILSGTIGKVIITWIKSGDTLTATVSGGTVAAGHPPLSSALLKITGLTSIITTTQINTRISVAIEQLIDKTIPAKYIKLPSRVWDDTFGYINLIWTLSTTSATWRATNYPSTITGIITQFPDKITEDQLKSYILGLHLLVSGKTPSEVKTLFQNSDKTYTETIPMSSFITDNIGNRASIIVTSANGKKFALSFNNYSRPNKDYIFDVNNGLLDDKNIRNLKTPGKSSACIQTSPTHMIIIGETGIFEYSVDDNGITFISKVVSSITIPSFEHGFIHQTSKTHIILGSENKGIYGMDLDSNGAIIQSSIHAIVFPTFQTELQSVQNSGFLQTSPTHALISTYNHGTYSVDLGPSGDIIPSSVKLLQILGKSVSIFLRTSLTHMLILNEIGLKEFELDNNGHVKSGSLKVVAGSSLAAPNPSVTHIRFMKRINKYQIIIKDLHPQLFVINLNENGQVTTTEFFKPNIPRVGTLKTFKDSIIIVNGETIYASFYHYDNKLFKISWFKQLLGDVTVSVAGKIITFTKPEGTTVQFRINGDHLSLLNNDELLTELIANKLKSSIKSIYKTIPSVMAVKLLPKTITVSVNGIDKQISLVWSDANGKAAWTLIGTGGAASLGGEVDGFASTLTQAKAYLKAAVAKIHISKSIYSSYQAVHAIEADANKKVDGSTDEDLVAKEILKQATFIPFGTSVIIKITYGNTILTEKITGFKSILTETSATINPLIDKTKPII
ncbi:MAG: hypothetical protein KAG14_03755, partial [Mycoplasmataceae bacterium]|nr:hypothetical protein [Mycoplasmataceae bacterium]